MSHYFIVYVINIFRNTKNYLVENIDDFDEDKMIHLFYEMVLLILCIQISKKIDFLIDCI